AILSLPLLTHFISNAPPPTALHPLSLHDALPICVSHPSHRWPSALTMPCSQATRCSSVAPGRRNTSSMGLASESTTLPGSAASRSEEHTSELQSRVDLVCRLLLDKKKKKLTQLLR